MRELPFLLVVAGVAWAQSAQAEPEKTHVHLTTNAPDVQLHMRTSRTWVADKSPWSRTKPRWSSTYAPLCKAPCSMDLALGGHTLTLSKGDGAPLDGDAVPIEIRGPSRIEGIHVSRVDTRWVGWALLVGSVTTGFATVLAAVLGNGQDCTGPDGCQSKGPGSVFAVGVLLSIVGGGIGTLLAATSDKVEINVIPLQLANRYEGGHRANWFDGSGLGLRVRF